MRSFVAGTKMSRSTPFPTAHAGLRTDVGEVHLVKCALYRSSRTRSQVPVLNQNLMPNFRFSEAHMTIRQKEAAGSDEKILKASCAFHKGNETPAATQTQL